MCVSASTSRNPMSRPSDPSETVRYITIDSELAGQRVDNFLIASLKGVPRSRLYRLLRKGEVRVNKGRVKPDYHLAAGDVVRIPPMRQGDSDRVTPAVGSSQLGRLQATIIYEDADLLVVNKPAGLAVHGGSGLSYGAIEALRVLYPLERSLELVHRLDKDTSGCLLISKRRSILRALHELMRRGEVEKRYLALLAGRVPWKERRVNAPLRKNVLRSGEREVRVDPAGSPSLTLFRCVKRFEQATLVEATLLTGRTHQIRVHAAHVGHPVLGDTKYGDTEANQRMRLFGLKRLFLHATALSFPRPGQGGTFRISALLPEELKAIVDALTPTK